MTEQTTPKEERWFMYRPRVPSGAWMVLPVDTSHPPQDSSAMEVVEVVPASHLARAEAVLRETEERLRLIGLPAPTGERGDLHPDALLPGKDVAAIEDSLRAIRAYLQSPTTQEDTDG
jgi:hypothetical protein